MSKKSAQIYLYHMLTRSSSIEPTQFRTRSNCKPSSSPFRNCFGPLLFCLLKVFLLLTPPICLLHPPCIPGPILSTKANIQETSIFSSPIQADIVCHFHKFRHYKDCICITQKGGIRIYTEHTEAKNSSITLNFTRIFSSGTCTQRKDTKNQFTQPSNSIPPNRKQSQSQFHVSALNLHKFKHKSIHKLANITLQLH